MAKDAKADSGIALLFGGKPKGGADALDDEGDDYSDEETSALWESAFGGPPEPGQYEAFKDLVRSCMGKG